MSLHIGLKPDLKVNKYARKGIDLIPGTSNQVTTPNKEKLDSPLDIKYLDVKII
jgi:hypothetical protein